ncbi:MAG: AsnC family transcriptional regulator [Methanothrix sp.]
MKNTKKELPESVRKLVDRLKAKSKYHIEVKSIRGGYYIYEYTFENRESGQKKVSFYLGKADSNGSFLEARHRFLNTRAKSLEEYIESGKGTGRPSEVAELIYPDEIDRAILTEISMDSKASSYSIAKKLNLNPNTVEYRIKKLERLYNIRYTIELRPGTFGFERYLITIRFIRGAPSQEDMKKLFGSEPRIQFVASLSGYYSVLIYMLAENNVTLENLIYDIRSNPIFKGCKAIWSIGYTSESETWYIPFRDEFFDLMREKVWHRSRENPRRAKDQLLESEYAVMKELNHDASVKFSDIDRLYNLKAGNAYYTFERLLERKTIKRPTIVMGYLPMRYVAFFYVVQKDISLFNRYRKEYLRTVIEESLHPCDKYAQVEDVSAPYGFILLAPIFDEGELEKLQEEVFSTAKGSNLRTSLITRVLIGSLGYRRFKMSESMTYKRLVDMENAEAKKQNSKKDTEESQ